MRYLSSRTAWETLISAVVAFAVSLIVLGPILGLLNSGWATGNELTAASDISHPVRNSKNFRPPRWRPETQKINPEFVQKP
jgi:hypothetical protein